MKPRCQHLTGDQGARTPPAGSPAPGLWPTPCCQGAQGASSSPGTWTGRASGAAASTQSSAGQLPLVTYKNETLCWLVTYQNEALKLVNYHNEALSLVKISCFREHFKNIFSIGYEERRGRVYTVGQDRSVSVTKLETGTKVSIEVMVIVTV